MSRNFEDQIYDMTIDHIQNGSQDNLIRDEYDRMMSRSQYNNANMKELFDHVLRMVDMGIDDCRTDRDVQNFCITCVDEAIAQHIGLWITSDTNLANSIEDDRIWNDLKRSAREWDAVESDYDRNQRGGRDRDSGRGGRGGRDERFERGSDRDRGGRGGRGYSRVSPSREERGGRDRGRDRDEGNGRLASGMAGRSNSRRAVEEPVERNSRWSKREEPVRQEVREEPVVHRSTDDMIDKNAGPDLTSARPFDSFWDNGKLWELAHVSKLEWTWTAEQQYRRAYDPEEEVCFLVKSEDGKVREEFIPMNDDLNFTSHEIKANLRPNDGRRIGKQRTDDFGEITMPGEDIDTVDLDRLQKQIQQARFALMSDLDVNSISTLTEPTIDSSRTDAAIKATKRRLNTGKDVVVIASYVTQIMPSTGTAMDDIVNLKNTLGGDVDLKSMRKRLENLRGKADESIMDAIDKHYTDEINHALKYVFEFGKLRIDSFIGDFEALLAVMTKKRSASYTAQFLQRTRPIMTSLAVEAGEGVCERVIDAQDILPESDDDSESYTTYRKNAVTFFRPIAMTSVKVDAVAFGILTDEPRFPTARGMGADEELLDTLKVLWIQSRLATPTGRVFIVTADNILLELIASCGAKDVVGVRKL